jgi:hypothetical protein
LAIGSIGIIYIVTISNTVFGGDAGDLVSAIITKGFPHPPGYPFYTILGILFNIIPISSLTSAGKVTLISTMSQILSLLVLYHILKELFLSKFSIRSAFIVILALGFNYLIWLYAVVPEVFPLNTLITLLIFYMTLRWYRKPKNFFLYLLFFLIGLGFCHHHTFVLILPSVAYLLYQKRGQIKKSKIRLSFICLSLILGFLPIVYLIISRLAIPKMIWGNPQTITGLFELLGRKGYGTFVPGAFISDQPLHRFIQFINLFFFVWNDFSFFGSCLIGLGLYTLLFKQTLEKPLRNAILLVIALYGPFFVFYANFPLGGKFGLATVERFFLVFYFFIAILLYAGVTYFLNLSQKILKKFIRNKTLRSLTYIGIMGIMFIYPLSIGLKTFQTMIPLKNLNISENLGRDIMQNAKENSLILLSADTVLFNTQYVYYSNESQYKHKYVIHASKLFADYYRQSLVKHYPSIRIPKNSNGINVQIFIEANISHFTIFSADKYELPTSHYVWVPQGLLYQLVPESEKNNKELEYSLDQFWSMSLNKRLEQNIPMNIILQKHFFLNDIFTVYAVAHQNSAFFYLERNNTDKALPHIQKSIQLSPDDQDNHYLLSLYYGKKELCKKAGQEIEIALKKTVDPLYLGQFESIIRTCYMDEVTRQELKRELKQYLQNQKINLRSF